MASKDDTQKPSVPLDADGKEMKTVETTEKQFDKDQAKGADRETEVDNETATRTSRYDQDLKERARTYGINPDNFETEEELGATVKKYEDDNGILGTPEERDQ